VFALFAFRNPYIPIVMTSAGGGYGGGGAGHISMNVRGYIDGCFDIMHSGHYNAIRQAKALCDVLIVGVHSDDEIAENKAMPVMNQKERYALLEHIKWIDEIIYDVPYSPQIATLDRARANFCIHGDDMPVNAQGYCAYDHMRDAGRLRIVRRTEGVSTTDIIGRLLTMAHQQHTPLELGTGGTSTPTHGVRVRDLRSVSRDLSIDGIPADDEDKMIATLDCPSPVAPSVVDDL
jgi:cytidyltransferase-like protein